MAGAVSRAWSEIVYDTGGGVGDIDKRSCLKNGGDPGTDDVWILIGQYTSVGTPAVAGGVTAFGGCDALLHVISLADGKQLWAKSYPVAIKPNHGISRTVPSVSGNTVVTLGPMCTVMGSDANSGALKWKIDLVSQYGATVPDWYAGQCPLIDGNKVILAPAGKALMIGVDLGTGKVLWSTPNPMGWSFITLQLG